MHNRTVEQKVGDTAAAFNALSADITPEPLRWMVTDLTSVDITETTDVAAYASLVQSSIHVARIVAANDRAAMLAAAMITQSGVARPVVTTEGDIDG
jgi:hypothetical protein